MKTILFVSFLTVIIACNQHQDVTNQLLQARIDSLEKKIDNAYKPGLGEFMSDIQVHHAKLWFAGKDENWKLADFEIGEIRESITDINMYCQDRKEIQSLSMIQPPLNAIDSSIKKKDAELFKSSFNILTNTCNNCHHSTNHEFNVIKIPDVPPVTNQIFENPTK